MSTLDGTTTPSPANTTTKGVFEFPPAKRSTLTRERLTTQDSGFGECTPQAAFSDAVADEASVANTVAPLTHDYVNTKGLIYMEDVHELCPADCMWVEALRGHSSEWVPAAVI